MLLMSSEFTDSLSLGSAGFDVIGAIHHWPLCAWVCSAMSALSPMSFSICLIWKRGKGCTRQLKILPRQIGED
jgi:hypothetical protein